MIQKLLTLRVLYNGQIVLCQKQILRYRSYQALQYPTFCSNFFFHIILILLSLRSSLSTNINIFYVVIIFFQMLHQIYFIKVFKMKFNTSLQSLASLKDVVKANECKIAFSTRVAYFSDDQKKKVFTIFSNYFYGASDNTFLFPVVIILLVQTPV